MTYFILSDDEELKANDFLHIIFKTSVLVQSSPYMKHAGIM